MFLEHSIDINRDPTEVFAYLAQHSNHTQFIEENVSCEQVTPGPMGVGTRVKNVARVFGREMVEHFEVVEFVPPAVLAKASREGSSFETTDRFELTPQTQGTHVRMQVTGRHRTWLEALILAALAPTVRRSMRRTLAKLKELLEAQASAPSSSVASTSKAPAT
jgi:carbon monoxide dehydrogenase subunit G